MPKTLSFRAPLSLLLRSQFCSAGSSSSRSTALLARNFAFRPTRPVMEKNTHRNGIDADNLKPAGRYDTRFRALLSEEASGGWEKCWEMGLTPWDLGGPTPIILHLLQNGSLPKGRALIPGCGTGYDVVEMASPERYVVGLDISKTVTNKATKMFSSSPNKEYFSFLSEDFFTWLPTEPFDLIFDYTFFCAIEPRMRPLWAKGMHELLKQDGELITLIFPIDDHDGGPPFRVTVSDYEDVLLPLGFSAISIEDNQHSVRPRKGMEKLGRWKKRSLVRSVL